MRRVTDEMRIQAILKAHGAHTDEIVRSDIGENRFKTGSREYLVLTETEAADQFVEYMESIADAMILCRLPEALRCYFDTDAYIRDVEINEGRGPALAPCDGIEHLVYIGDIDLYVYRCN